MALSNKRNVSCRALALHCTLCLAVTNMPLIQNSFYSRKAMYCKTFPWKKRSVIQSSVFPLLTSSAQRWNTLQHTATHCNTLQHTAIHCNALQRTAAHCNTLPLPCTLRRSASKSHMIIPWLILHTVQNTIELFLWKEPYIIRLILWKEPYDDTVTPWLILPTLQNMTALFLWNEFYFIRLFLWKEPRNSHMMIQCGEDA